jgi:LuxR family transcriptional regulator, quorum-sensing system regulator SolR
MLRFEDFVESSRRSATTDELARLYADAVGTEGYENCILTSLRGRKLGHIAWFRFPAGYVNAYVQNRWEKIDPVLACTLRAARPFFWSDVEKTALDGEQAEFMSACRELSVHSGVMFPFHGPHQRLDVMSISRRIPDAPNPERISLLQAITTQAWSRYQELSEEQLFVDPEQLLTPRELEILKRCKDGKSRPEIGEILSISPKTVEFHLRGIMDKLGASNQISAVVIALQRGLLEL